MERKRRREAERLDDEGERVSQQTTRQHIYLCRKKEVGLALWKGWKAADFQIEKDANSVVSYPPPNIICLLYRVPFSVLQAPDVPN